MLNQHFPCDFLFQCISNLLAGFPIFIILMTMVFKYLSDAPPSSPAVRQRWCGHCGRDIGGNNPKQCDRTCPSRKYARDSPNTGYMRGH
jgi:hypothetical protein